MAATPALLACSAALAAASPVVVEGRAALDGDRARAEEQAKRDARREALERGAEVSVQSMSVVRQFALVSDTVAVHARGVLRDEAWGPVRVEGREVRVSLRARVEASALGDEACRVLTAEREPVVIAVVSMRGARRDPITEAELIDQLIGACVRVVHMDVDALDPRVPQPILDRAQQLGARYVLFSEASREAGGARVVDVGDNRIVASAPGRQPRVLADELFRQLASGWADDASRGALVAVELHTALSFQDAKALARACTKAIGAAPPDDVTLRDGVARFRVRIQGGGRAAADKLDGLSLGEPGLPAVRLEARESGASFLTLAATTAAPPEP